jgi:outer membrane protein assembly factor BamB
MTERTSAVKNKSLARTPESDPVAQHILGISVDRQFPSVLTCLQSTTFSTEGAVETTMYRGNLQNTGVYGTRAARTFGDEPNWVYQAKSWISSQLVAGDGTLFFVTRPGVVHAVDIVTGAEKWMSHLGKNVYTSPAVAQGHLILTDSDTNQLIVLDVLSGKPIPTDLKSDDDEFYSSPKIVENVALIGGWNSLHVISIPEFRSLMAPGLDTDCEGAITSYPAVANGIAYFAVERGAICGLDRATGQILSYEFDIRMAAVGDPAYYNKSVYILVSNDEDLFEPGPSKTLLALNIVNGNISTHEIAPTFVKDSPAIFDNTAYFGCNDGAVYAIDLEDWKLEWRFQTGGAVNSSPSIVAGLKYVLESLIYFGSDDGHLYVVNAETGGLVRKLPTASGAPVRTCPVLSDGAVYFGDTVGNLYSWGSAADLSGR